MKTKNTSKLTFKASVEIPIETLQHLLITALEGGSNYWYSDVTAGGLGDKTIDDFRGGDHPWFATIPFDIPDSYLAITEDIEDEPVTLRVADMLRGLLVMSELRQDRFAVIISGGDWDALDADLWLQYSLFGECVYG